MNLTGLTVGSDVDWNPSKEVRIPLAPGQLVCWDLDPCVASKTLRLDIGCDSSRTLLNLIV